MIGRDIVWGSIFLLGAAILPLQLWSSVSRAAEAMPQIEELDVNPSLVREMQFMLLRLGVEPGPIDGVIGPLTTKAWRKFEQNSGLPHVDLVNGGKIPASALAHLRSEAVRVIFEGEKKPEVPAETPPPPALAAPVQPPAPEPDRFAACPFDPEDFRIGKTQFTPKKYLQEGFDGSTA